MTRAKVGLAWAKLPCRSAVQAPRPPARPPRPPGPWEAALQWPVKSSADAHLPSAEEEDEDYSDEDEDSDEAGGSQRRPRKRHKAELPPPGRDMPQRSTRGQRMGALVKVRLWRGGCEPGRVAALFKDGQRRAGRAAAGSSGATATCKRGGLHLVHAAPYLC